MSSTRQIRPNVPNIFFKDCSLACNGILPTKMEQRSITRWLLSLFGDALMVDLERRIGSGWNEWFPNLLLTSSGIRGCSRRYLTSSRNPWFYELRRTSPNRDLTAWASRQSWKNANMIQIPSGRRNISFSVCEQYHTFSRAPNRLNAWCASLSEMEPPVTLDK